MNSLSKLFSTKNKDLLSIYFTAGFPKLEDTVKILTALQECGVDLVEIGMPYSDPLADGPVIQSSSVQALKNGMSIQKLFQQLEDYNQQKRLDENKMPLILMGYLNPVMQYGIEKFCADAASVGISGIILPDLPIQEYELEYKSIFEKNNLSFIFLITPETSKERIQQIDELSTGFIYAVSSSSITGGKANFDSQNNYFHKLKGLNLKNEIIIGFGIKDRSSFLQANQYATGAIIGTAYIQALSNGKDVVSDTHLFINSILKE
jgi:tryptophan synthase alpha chain